MLLFLSLIPVSRSYPLSVFPLSLDIVTYSTQSHTYIYRICDCDNNRIIPKSLIYKAFSDILKSLVNYKISVIASLFFTCDSTQKEKIMENETEKKKYVSDIIGNDYTKWRQGEVKFLNAQTGSGKTYFILNKLLPYVCSQNGKILYLVNRYSLKNQIEKEIYRLSESPDYPLNAMQHIKIDTYQSLEHFLQNNVFCNYFPPLSPSSTCKLFVILDEAHYFYTDSIFNPYTYSSFYSIFFERYRFCTVLISATIENYINDIVRKIHIIIQDILDDRIKSYNYIYHQYEVYPFETTCKK